MENENQNNSIANGNSITITGKKKSEDKTTEISYSYKVYFDSTNKAKALSDVALAEELVSSRSKPDNKQDNAPIGLGGGHAI